MSDTQLYKANHRVTLYKYNWKVQVQLKRTIYNIILPLSPIFQINWLWVMLIDYTFKSWVLLLYYNCEIALSSLSVRSNALDANRLLRNRGTRYNKKYMPSFRFTPRSTGLFCGKGRRSDEEFENGMNDPSIMGGNGTPKPAESTCEANCTYDSVDGGTARRQATWAATDGPTWLQPTRAASTSVLLIAWALGKSAHGLKK